MRVQIPVVAFLAVAWVLLASPTTRAQIPEESPYKELSTAPVMEPIFTVSFTQEDITVTVWIDSVGYTAFSSLNGLQFAADRVVIDRTRLWFDSEGLHFTDPALPEPHLIPYTEIADTRIIDDDQSVEITFLTVRGDTGRLGRLRRGNEITFSDPITVQSKDFVRGLVMSVSGKVEIYGEVNKDVISLFGDIYVAPGATTRGDIASVTGFIDPAKDASVYGELYSGSDYFGRRRPWLYRQENLDFLGKFVYNRVDGATPYLGLKFCDDDSLLPTVWATAGYAFESSRWRVELGLEQPLYRRVPLALGGAYYRRLASEDEWLLTEIENTFLALLISEDYRDYWEAEGVILWLKTRPVPELELGINYRYEETNWRRAHRNLWSLVGANNRFRRNFHYVPQELLDPGIEVIDTSVNGALSFHAGYDTRHPEEPFSYPGWLATADLEWSHPDFSSDFDYRRYMVSVKRYQPLHTDAALLLRVVLGGSDGWMPMHKRFYLGGLGTIEGYRFKEYLGTRFWLANAEYRFEFPGSDIAASVFWHMGQIANETKLSGDIDLKQSVGAAVMVGTDLRISLAKRLDRSDDSDPLFLARLNYEF